MTSLKRFTLLGLLAVSSACFATQSTRAALVYSVGISALTTVGPGANFTGTVYLQEVATAGETTVLGTPITGGLGTGNFTINRTAGSSIDITGATGNAAFDSPVSVIFTVSDASVVQSHFDVPSTPTGTLVAANTYRLTLGTISFTATAFGDTTFTLADYDPDPLTTDLVLGDGTELDGVNGIGVTFGDITISSAPEPTTMGALGAFGAIGAAVSYLRRRKKKTGAVTLA